MKIDCNADWLKHFKDIGFKGAAHEFAGSLYLQSKVGSTYTFFCVSQQTPVFGHRDAMQSLGNLIAARFAAFVDGNVIFWIDLRPGNPDIPTPFSEAMRLHQASRP